MWKFIQSIIASTLNFVANQVLDLVKSPLTMLWSAAGLTGEQRAPSTPADFTPPNDTRELVDELMHGHNRLVATRSLDSDAVTAVYKLRNATDRSSVNLESVERDDVRDILFTMPQAKLEDLCQAGRPAILKYLKTGDSGVFGVPLTLSARLRAARAEMAKPKGSLPFVMPTMP